MIYMGLNQANFPTSPHRLEESPMDKEQVAAVLWGNTLEYFDSLMYVHMMIIITPLFFPTHEPVALSLFAATGFSVNYLARPVGALMFGYIGDKLGRKPALYISITMMLLATGFIGILPVYAQAGIYASLALLILRFFQGISCSGEASGALIYLMESVPYEKRFFYSALYNATIISGGVIAALVITFSLHLLAAESAWRFPFQIAAVIGIAGLLMRYNLSETKEFKLYQLTERQVYLREILFQKDYFISILRVAGFSSFDATTFWVCYVFMAELLKKHTGLETSQIVLHNGAIMIFQILSGFLIAQKAPLLGEKRLGLLATYALILAIFPLFLTLQATAYSYAMITLAQIIVITAGNAFVIATDPTRVFLFPVIGRFIGMAFGISLGRVLGYVIGAYLLIASNYLFGPIGVAFYVLIFILPAWWAIKTLPLSPCKEQEKWGQGGNM